MIHKALNKEWDIKEEYLNPSEIRYAKEMSCCSIHTNRDSYMGYTHTQNGYMMVFKCNNCKELYRYHNCTTERTNFEKFKNEIALVLYCLNKNK